MAQSPASILYDESGNAVGVLLDGSVYRIQVEAQLAPGASVQIGGVTPEDPGDIFRERVENGGSDDMLVDGSVTPVLFTVGADATKDTSISEVRFVLSANKFNFGEDNFGSQPALTNGVKLEVVKGGTPSLLALIQQNEDFLTFYSPGGIFFDSAGTNDILGVGIFLGGAVILDANTSDEIRVSIQDDLTSTLYKYFTATVFGSLKTP
jgi:hypothetical protein